MKKSAVILLIFICYKVSIAQVKTVGEGVTKNGKDTLNPPYHLTQKQTLELYSFSIDLGKQERELQHKYAGTDSLNVELKKLEGKKDELYKKILPNDKYLLYRQRRLVIMSSGSEIIE